MLQKYLWGEQAAWTPCFIAKISISSEDKPDEALCQAVVLPDRVPPSRIAPLALAPAVFGNAWSAVPLLQAPASEDLQSSLSLNFRATRIQMEKSGCTQQSELGI